MCYFVNHCPTPTAHSFALYLMPSALRGSSQVHSSQYLSITSPSLSGPEVSNPIMKVEASGTWLSRTSSIENEPRTLSFQEIECAREAALFVMKTRSAEDAMSIFTKGLKPVPCAGIHSRIQPDSHFCNDIEDKLIPAEPRDVASAPF